VELARAFGGSSSCHPLPVPEALRGHPLIGFLDIIGPVLAVRLGAPFAAITAAPGGEALAHGLKERFLAYLRRDDTLTYSTIFTVVGTVAK
jgi:hypothetical protein